MNIRIPHGLTAIVGLIALAALFWGIPQFNVYRQTMRGKADFREAEINRQILVEEAKAQEEALALRASGEAERERIRAAAAAEAIAQVGEAISQHPEYLRYHWINTLNDGNSERIYIPTEGGMPIMEAGSGPPPVPGSISLELIPESKLPQGLLERLKEAQRNPARNLAPGA